MRKLIKYIAALSVSALFSAGLHAQEVPVNDTDSLLFSGVSTVDSTLVGKSVFDVIGSGVKVSQTYAVGELMNEYVRTNSSRTISGYRVRIFFSSTQDARGTSESVQKAFQESYRGIAAYRTYQNPFFKVTVGDFRTRSEAVQLLQRIKYDYPSAFVVKETINYPVVNESD